MKVLLIPSPAKTLEKEKWAPEKAKMNNIRE
jgi:hypothetical protein